MSTWADTRARVRSPSPGSAAFAGRREQGDSGPVPRGTLASPASPHLSERLADRHSGPLSAHLVSLPPSLCLPTSMPILLHIGLPLLLPTPPSRAHMLRLAHHRALGQGSKDAMGLALDLEGKAGRHRPQPNMLAARRTVRAIHTRGACPLDHARLTPLIVTS